MPLYKLDANRKPITTKSRKAPARDAEGRFHFKFQCLQSKKYPISMNRNFWAHESEVEAIIQSMLTGGGSPASSSVAKETVHAGGLRWVDAYALWCSGHSNVSPSHIENLERSIKDLCKHFDNPDLTLEGTTRTMMRQWLNKHSQKSGASANKAREIFIIARYCQNELDDLISQPLTFLGIKKYTHVSKRSRADIPLAELGGYLEACTAFHPALRHIVDFLLFSGVRSTEACELQEDRIGETITILQKGKGQGKREAEVVVDDYLTQIINRALAYKDVFRQECREEILRQEKMLERYTNDARRWGRAKRRIAILELQIKHSQGKHVFICRIGTPWNKDSVRKTWTKACNQAGLPYFVPHELRHTHATTAGELDFPTKFIQAAMRWDTEGVANRYVHEKRTLDRAKEVEDAVRARLAEHVYGPTTPGVSSNVSSPTALELLAAAGTAKECQAILDQFITCKHCKKAYKTPVKPKKSPNV